MSHRFQQGLMLTKQAVALLMRSPKLLLLPAAAVLINLGLLAIAVYPLYQYTNLHGAMTRLELEHFWIYYGVLLIFLFNMHLVFYFFNGSFVYCIHDHLDGKNPSILKAMGNTTRRFLQIYGFVFYGATIGIFIALLLKLALKIKSIRALLCGQIWPVAILLIKPVLVLEKRGPLASIKRSASLVTKRWGAPALPNLATWQPFMLVRAILMVGLIIYAGFSTLHQFTIAVAVVAVFMVMITVVHHAVALILRTVLYRYITTGSIAANFSEPPFAKAFRSWTSNSATSTK